MRHLKAFLIAAPVAAGLLLAPGAQAERGDRGGYQQRGHGQYSQRGYRGHYEPPRHYGHRGNDGSVAALVLGLGAAAVIGGLLAAQPQYAPPPVAYAPQAYPAPGYYPGNGYAAPYGYQAPYGYVPQYGN